MAGGSTGRKGARKRAGAKTRRDAEARPPKPVLGNDPFARGAAPRAPAVPGLAPAARVSSEGTATRAATPIPAPTVARTPTASAARTPTAPPARTPTASPARTPTRAAPSAATRLDEVERKVESAFEGIEARLTEAAARAGLGHAREELGEAVSRLLPALRERLASMLDLARLLEPPERLDRFGMDVRFAERAEPLIELLYSSWWRVVVRAPEQVPAAGPAIVVANHAGLIPWDALVLRHALRRDHPARRDLRPLLDDREVGLPVLGGIAVRLGAVRAEPESAERILRDGGLLGVFPEGSAGARKPWRDRYRIQRFGRGGFVKIALRTGAPIVPCAIVGSEEASPGISRTGWLAERLGIPLLSASSLFRLGPAALVPLPSKWSLRFGEPVEVGERGPEAADDPAVVAALTDRVRAALQAMVDEDVAARSSVFL